MAPLVQLLPLLNHRSVADAQGSELQLDTHDANEPNILEPQHLPDTEVLAEGFRGCLQVWSHCNSPGSPCRSLHTCVQVVTAASQSKHYRRCNTYSINQKPSG